MGVRDAYFPNIAKLEKAMDEVIKTVAPKKDTKDSLEQHIHQKVTAQKSQLGTLTSNKLMFPANLRDSQISYLRVVHEIMRVGELHGTNTLGDLQEHLLEMITWARLAFRDLRVMDLVESQLDV